MQAPPPVINSARVIVYADVEDIPYRKAGRLYVGDKLLEKVPRLAIWLNLGEDLGAMLFHCDGNWNCLGTSGSSAVEETMSLAERNYPGVASRWVETGVTLEEAMAYYDEDTAGMRCSFCRRRPFELTCSVVHTELAAICRDCVEKLYDELREGSGRVG